VTTSLASLVRALENIAPLELAEPWDNVGVLVDPREPNEELEVHRVLLTIDATPAVLREARDAGVQCLVAYHPPIFQPAKRFARRVDGALFEAISAGMAIYSPHTALDAAPGGLNDWLAEAFGAAQFAPLHQSLLSEAGAELKLVVFVPRENADRLRDALSSAGAGVIGNYSHCSFNLEGEGTFFGEEGADPVVGRAGRLERAAEIRLEMVCAKRDLARAARAIAQNHPYEEPAWDVYPLAPKPRLRAGSGRLVTLDVPRPLDELIGAVKAHLGLEHLRVAATDSHRNGHPIQSIGVCAGSGATVLQGAPADLYLTGELGHHHVLRALRDGASVLLCEHSNTERGYLPRLRERLLAQTAGEVDVLLAAADVEPLRVV